MGGTIEYRCAMAKIVLYKAILDCAVAIRGFMFQENHYLRSLDEALQPFIDFVSSSIEEMSEDGASERV